MVCFGNLLILSGESLEQYGINQPKTHQKSSISNFKKKVRLPLHRLYFQNI